MFQSIFLFKPDAPHTTAVLLELWNFFQLEFSEHAIDSLENHIAGSIDLSADLPDLRELILSR